MRDVIKTQSGRSMIEMLGVLAVIGILTVAGIFGYQKAIMKSRVNKTIEVAALSLQKYADFTLKNTRGMDVSGENAMADASTVGLSDTCNLVDSEIEDGYSVCDVPLGEMFLTFQDKGNDTYNYMLFVTLVDDDIEACKDFLVQGWDQIIPPEWQNNAVISVKSDSGYEVVYPEGFKGVTPTSIASVCNSVCPKSEEYCAVIFDIGGIQGGI